MVARTLRLALPLMTLVLGCSTSDAPPQLLDVTDFAPREVGLGDRMELIGRGFPEGKPAKVTFRGTLYRPGEKAERGFELSVDAASTSSETIEMVFDAALESSFCGPRDKAVHTTFRGEVVASFSGATPGSLPIVGSVHDAQIDLAPPPPRRTLAEAREAEGGRALAFMGLEVAPDALPSGGLLVTGVREDGPADRAGVGTGDLLVAFEGVRVRAKSDVVPSGSARFAEAAFRRAAPFGGMPLPATASDVVRRISVQGFKPTAPPGLLAAGLALLLAAAAAVLIAGPLASAVTRLERRFAKRTTTSRGRAGLLGQLRDGARALLHEDVGPIGTTAPLVRLVPYFVLLGVSATFAAMPFGQHLVAADLDLGILFVLGESTLVATALVSAGHSAGFVDRLRAAGRVAACALPGALALGCIVMMTGSLRIDEVVRAQGAFPWQWFVFRNPITFVASLLWLASSIVETTARAPSGVPEAEPEARSGRRNRPSGTRETLRSFAEWGNVFVTCGLAAALFLGGSRLPHLPALERGSGFLLSCAGAIVFLAKMWLLVLGVVWLRARLPRLQTGEMASLSLRWLVPASLTALAATAAWEALAPPAQVDAVVGVGTFLVWLGLTTWIALRSRLRERSVHPEIAVSPFL